MMLEELHVYQRLKEESATSIFSGWIQTGSTNVTGESESFR